MASSDPMAQADSAAQNGNYQHEDDDETELEEKPAVSERIKAAATHAKEQVQDTVSSALHKARVNWKTVCVVACLLYVRRQPYWWLTYEHA